MALKVLRKFSTPQLREVVMYTAGCGISLVLKAGLATFFNHMGLSFWVAYFITHVILLFCSFFYHHFITFKKKIECIRQTFEDFIDFSATVIVLKLLDYVLVNVGIKTLSDYVLPEDMAVSLKYLINIGMIFCVSIGIFILRYFIYRILFRKPPLEYYVGNNVKQVFLTYASDADVSGNAASGGTVTALLLNLLQNGKIDGALVTVSDFSQDKEKRFRTIIARKPDELLRSQGSVYCDFRYLTPETLNELRTFSGKIAAVGLPCQLKQLDGVGKQYPEIAEKIVLKIGLFCGHTSKPELLENVFAEKSVSESEVAAFRFRQGKWRGNAKVVLKNGETIQWPTAFYNLYQNLFVAAPKRCLSCFDHFAEQADISTGDIWCQKYRFAPVKPSMTAIRTELGEQFFSESVLDGAIITEEKKVKDLYKANSRSVIFHKAIAARAAVFKRYGITIPVPQDARPARWNEILAARIIAAFFDKKTNDVMNMNRRFLKFCLYVMKGLTSF